MQNRALTHPSFAFGDSEGGCAREVLKGHCILVRAAELAYNSQRSMQPDAYYLNCSSATGSAPVISAGSLNCLGGLPAGAAVGRFCRPKELHRGTLETVRLRGSL